MCSKRASTVRVECVTVFCTHRPSIFPILTFNLMLTTCAMVDVFKLYCRKEGKVVTWFLWKDHRCSMSYFNIVRDNVSNWYIVL